MKDLRNVGLKRQIHLLTFLPFLLVTILFVLASYYYFLNNKLTQMTETAQADTSYISENVDKTLQSGMNFVQWIYFNNDLASALQNYNPDKADTVYALLQAQDAIQSQFFYTQVGSYISIVLSHGNNGGEILNGEKIQYNSNLIKSESWFETLQNNSNVTYWSNVVPYNYYENEKSYVYPCLINIYGKSSTPKGWCFIGFNETMLEDIYKSRDSSTNRFLITTLDGTCVSSANKTELGKKMLNSAILKKIGNSEQGSIKNGKYNIVYRTSPQTKLLPINQTSLFLLYILLVLFGSLLLYIPISFVVTNSILKPVKVLLGHMKEISKGDFKRNEAIESENEIGLLGIGINKMSENISRLLESQIKDEKKKKELEIQMLQAQINPHFLYNTLNTIRWMAIVQNAPGISDTVTALSRLIRNLAKGTDQKITLSEELSIIKDFMLIQELRYSGRMKLEIEIPEALMSAKIIKFTFQPIIENAIFHGLEPKASAGIVRISAKKLDEDLYIQIWDDGIGISEEKAGNILDASSQHHNSLNGIGLSNVDERIRLTYGSTYGLKVASVEGEYTEVTIHIPYETE
jgi:two-component system sensor histidine kinase YesM